MQEQVDTNQLVINKRPVFFLTTGIVMLLFAAAGFLLSKDLLSLIIPLFISLVFIAISQSTTIVADRIKRTMTISNQSIFGKKEVEIPFSQIADFDVETSRSRPSNRQRSTNYRLVLIKTNGERFPVRNMYTNGYNEKARQAKELCQFLNLPGWEDKATNIFQAAIQGQARITIQPEKSEQGTSSGVAWSIEGSRVGDRPVTRWFSSDFTSPGNFLLIAQKPAGSSAISGSGFLGNIVLMVYRQILGIYGFLPSDVPGFDSAGAVHSQDDGFNRHFSVLSNDPEFGHTTLNQWTMIPCKNWAEHHPLKTINTEDQVGQMVVLLSPRGVHAAVMGTLPRNQTDELISIGVDIVKAQGGGMSIS